MSLTPEMRAELEDAMRRADHGWRSGFAFSVIQGLDVLKQLCQGELGAMFVLLATEDLDPENAAELGADWIFEAGIEHGWW